MLQQEPSRHPSRPKDYNKAGAPAKQGGTELKDSRKDSSREMGSDIRGSLLNDSNGGDLEPEKAFDPTLTFPIEANAHRSEAMERTPTVLKESTGWDVYNNEAKKVDAELVKDWRDSLNTLLVFASIFAAVLTAVIIDTKRQLEPDSNAIMLDVLITLTNNLANGTHTTFTKKPFVPSPEAVTTNCLLFASLGISLAAALTSVTALQWVADYDAAITRGGGAPIDEAKRRQLLFGGILSWRMGEIIAVLPLMLYGAVILFFAGAIEWIWITNSTVGKVLATAAAVALVFYVVTTILAISFVSAPFRTPLSRGMYLIIRLLSWLVKRLVTGTETFYLNPRRRPDHAVDGDETLIQQALLWVGRELSLNDHSHRRFLLLVSELSKLSPILLRTPKFQEAPWPAIFDLVGAKYLRRLQSGGFDEGDGQNSAWLAQIAHTPEISAIIAPKNDGPSLRGIKRPNATFLLTRDTPVASSISRAERQAVIQIIKWRNTGCDETRTPWREIFVRETPYSNTFFNSLVDIFARYATSIYVNAVDRPHMFFDVFLSIAQGAISRGIPQEMATSIFYAFEEMLICSFAFSVEGRRIEQRFKVEGGIMNTPYSYAKALQQSDDIAHNIHDALLILLARSIGAVLVQGQPDEQSTLEEISQNVRELLAMVWFRLGNEDVRSWASASPRTDWINYLWGSNSALWSNAVVSLPHSFEIIRLVNEARRQIPKLNPVWLFHYKMVDHDVSSGKMQSVIDDWRTGPRDWLTWTQELVVNSTRNFNSLLNIASTPEEHLEIVTILYRDLRKNSCCLKRNTADITPQKDSLCQINDPCLRLLISWMLDIPALPNILPTADYLSRYQHSWDLVVSHISQFFPNRSSVPRHYRESFLPFISTERCERFTTRALLHPAIFVSGKLAPKSRLTALQGDLENMFHYRASESTAKNRWNGTRLLIYLWRYGQQHTDPFLEDTSAPPLLEFECDGRHVSTLLNLLLADARLNETTSRTVHLTCALRIREISRPIMAQQEACLLFIAGILRDPSFLPRLGDVVIILYLFRKALQLSGKHTPNILLMHLASRLGELSDQVSRSSPHRREVEIANSLKMTGYLLRAKAGTPLWSNSHLKIISCARSANYVKAAMGWMSMEDGLISTHAPGQLERTENDENFNRMLAFDLSSTEFEHPTEEEPMLSGSGDDNTRSSMDSLATDDANNGIHIGSSY